MVLPSGKVHQYASEPFGVPIPEDCAVWLHMVNLFTGRDDRSSGTFRTDHSWQWVRAQTACSRATLRHWQLAHAAAAGSLKTCCCACSGSRIGRSWVQALHMHHCSGAGRGACLAKSQSNALALAAVCLSMRPQAQVPDACSSAAIA